MKQHLDKLLMYTVFTLIVVAAIATFYRYIVLQDIAVIETEVTE